MENANRRTGEIGTPRNLPCPAGRIFDIDILRSSLAWASHGGKAHASAWPSFHFRRINTGSRQIPFLPKA